MRNVKRIALIILAVLVAALLIFYLYLFLTARG